MTTLQECQCNETKDLFSSPLGQFWGRIKGMAGRYRQWQKMKHNHRMLLTMEDRLLNDIGLSRADAVRISNAHTFWKFVFQPESGDMQDRTSQNNR